MVSCPPILTLIPVYSCFEFPVSDGEIKTQSLMGNVYYRYPKWRVSPYAGVGFGAFFHDRTVTSTITVENIGQPFLEIFPPLARIIRQ